MRGSAASPAVESVTAGLDALAATDVVALDDESLRQDLVDLVAAANRVQAELVRRVDVFDRRGLARDDGFRTAKAWLQAFGRMSGSIAGRLVKAARVLRRLPKLAVATQSGAVSPELVAQVTRLAGQVGIDRVEEVEATLADAAQVLDPSRLAQVVDRVQAHLDPDGPDPAEAFARRGLTLSPADGGMVVLRGQLDPEGGAALATALDAMTPPPAEGDERSAAQRRADALVELARQALVEERVPQAGGHRPQVGVLLFPQALSPETLARLAELRREEAAGRRLAGFLPDPDAGAKDTGTPDGGRDWARAGATGEAGDRAPEWFGRTAADLRADLRAGLPGELARPGEPGRPEAADRATVSEAAGPARAGPAPGDSPPAWSRVGWADPPWLDWVGSIPPAVAQRIACDADIWRILLDPDTGMPLDVGRGYRLVPHWIRRALHARDRGCRWPGCTVPTQWTDGHHLDPWADHGETKVERCVLLCRHHHGLVHEGGWGIDLDLATGQVHVTRPGGLPFRLPASPSWTGPTSRTG